MQAAAAYGQGLPAAAGYPATHPGIPAPTVAGPTNTTQFQKQAYGSRYLILLLCHSMLTSVPFHVNISAPSYGNSYGDSLSLGQSNTGYKNSYGQSESQGKSNTSGSSAGKGLLIIRTNHVQNAKDGVCYPVSQVQSQY